LQLGAKISKIEIERAACPMFVHFYDLNQTEHGEKAKIEPFAGERPPGQL
jgi:hypothetical protein